MAELFDLIGDRQWHRVMHLREEMNGIVKPEDAVEVFERASKNSRPDRFTLEAKAELGRAAALKDVLSMGVGVGAVERNHLPGTLNAVRWIRWYCWSCGDAQNNQADRPADSLCPDCRKIFTEVSDGGTNADATAGE
jgi:hypothetical protein